MNTRLLKKIHSRYIIKANRTEMAHKIEIFPSQLFRNVFVGYQVTDLKYKTSFLVGWGSIHPLGSLGWLFRNILSYRIYRVWRKRRKKRDQINYNRFIKAYNKNHQYHEI